MVALGDAVTIPHRGRLRAGVCRWSFLTQGETCLVPGKYSDTSVSSWTLGYCEPLEPIYTHFRRFLGTLRGGSASSLLYPTDTPEGGRVPRSCCAKVAFRPPARLPPPHSGWEALSCGVGSSLLLEAGESSSSPVSLPRRRPVGEGTATGLPTGALQGGTGSGHRFPRDVGLEQGS